MTAGSDAPEETFPPLLGLGNAWPAARTEFAEKTSAFALGVEETAGLWPAEGGRAGATVTCGDHVGRSSP